MSKKAIGVFDSGLGGLTVVKELMRLLPQEDIIYYGDTARVPYGTKSKEAIIRFSCENTDVLLKHNVKMVVVACNSCSSYALPILRKKYKVPILGVIRPGARKAVQTTRNRRIGVIATSATVNSNAYIKNIKILNQSLRVWQQPCPLFVPLAEEGWFDKSASFNIAREYLAPLKKMNIDTLILGCTHYPLLKSILQKAIGGKVTLIDSAREVACEVKNLLGKKNLLNPRARRKANYTFLISDRPQAFKKLARNFLGRELEHIKKV
ncbi:MAG: glutamate racemase [Candidatus Omnitrophota bacterium]|nr:glutamate racemase [Candidatus Omnitrophota bacterium]